MAAERIVRRLRWLAEHVDQVRHAALSGPFEGAFKLRVGDYRVAYTIETDVSVIRVHAIGHRREVYRRRRS